MSQLTWAKFHTLFFKKYVSYTLHNEKNDELLAFEFMPVASYKAKFYVFSYYATQLIWLLVKGLTTDLEVLTIHMASAGNTFNEIANYVKK